MSDNQPAVEAATNPAESTKVEESADVKLDAKPDASGEVDNAEATNATDDAKPAGADAANGSADKTEESSNVKSKEKDTNGADRNGDKESRGRHNQGRFNKHDRGGRRGGESEKNKQLRKNEFANLPDSDDPVEIRAQVEFYFSVQNLSTDHHLFLELDGPNNRPVSIKHISQFTRMRRFKPYSAIVAALRESEDLVVVDDGEYSGIGNEAVKRKEALVVPKRPDDDKYEPDTEELFQRMLKSSINKLENSVYVKGFAKDGEDVGQITLEHFFKPFGAVMVRKRRDEDQTWKGSVFVEFDSEESQQQFLTLDPKPKYNGNELTIMSKKDYSEMKCKEKGITPAWLRNEEYTHTSGRGHRDRREYRDRGDRDRGGRGRGRGGRGGRGDRSGRYNDRDRDGGRHDRHGRNRDRRARSGSRSSEEDWKTRRARDQKSKGYKNKDDKADNETQRKLIERDAQGVPVVQDTRTPEEKAASKKRKTEDEDRVESPKKSKIQIKEDE